jgi:hypothetical protein
MQQDTAFGILCSEAVGSQMTQIGYKAQGCSTSIASSGVDTEKAGNDDGVYHQKEPSTLDGGRRMASGSNDWV